MSDVTFAGFAAPTENWTRMPNALIDALPIIESLGELKVILYTLRHTWGFQDFQDGQRLTLDEYMNGKQTHEGRRTDGGTGMSKPSIIAGIRHAIQHGFLEVQKQGRERLYLPKVQKFSGKESLPDENIHKEVEGKTSLPSTVKLLYPEGKTSLPSDTTSVQSAPESADPLKKEKERERKNTSEGGSQPEPKTEISSSALAEGVSSKPKPFEKTFDVLALECFSLKKGQVNGEGGRIGTILHGRKGKNGSPGLWRLNFALKEYTPERDQELSEELGRMFAWWRDTKPKLSVPTSDLSIWKALCEFRKTVPPPPNLDANGMDLNYYEPDPVYPNIYQPRGAR